MVAVSVYLRSRTRHRAKVARSSVAGMAGDVPDENGSTHGETMKPCKTPSDRQCSSLSKRD